MKCFCCKFDNCRAEFDKRRNNTSFSALNRKFSEFGLLIADVDKLCASMCDSHKVNGIAWIDQVFRYYDTLKSGVLLPKVTNIK